MQYSDFWGLAGAPLVVAVLELIKRVIPELSQRWYPISALVAALAINLTIAWQLQTDLVLAVFVAVVVSLTASGLYGQGKALRGK